MSDKKDDSVSFDEMIDSLNSIKEGDHKEVDEENSGGYMYLIVKGKFNGGPNDAGDNIFTMVEEGGRVIRFYHLKREHPAIFPLILMASRAESKKSGEAVSAIAYDVKGKMGVIAEIEDGEVVKSGIVAGEISVKFDPTIH